MPACTAQKASLHNDECVNVFSEFLCGVSNQAHSIVFIAPPVFQNSFLPDSHLRRRLGFEKLTQLRKRIGKRSLKSSHRTVVELISDVLRAGKSSKARAVLLDKSRNHQQEPQKGKVA